MQLMDVRTISVIFFSSVSQKHINRWIDYAKMALPMNLYLHDAL